MLCAGAGELRVFAAGSIPQYTVDPEMENSSDDGSAASQRIVYLDDCNLQVAGIG